MRLTRERGQTGPRRAVETAYERLTADFKPYHQIAVDLFDQHPTGSRVKAEIQRVYDVTISEKTASDWINRGLGERRRQLAASGSSEVGEAMP